MKITITKFGNIEVEKQKFQEQKIPISTTKKKKQILIKQQYLKSSFLSKKELNILLATKIPKKLNLYVYFSQKQVHTEKTKYVSFLKKGDKLLEKYGKKLKIVSKRI